jgi:hypothetical protein
MIYCMVWSTFVALLLRNIFYRSGFWSFRRGICRFLLKDPEGPGPAAHKFLWPKLPSKFSKFSIFLVHGLVFFFANFGDFYNNFTTFSRLYLLWAYSTDFGAKKNLESLINLKKTFYRFSRVFGFHFQKLG